MEAFARELGARVEWRRLSAFEALDALEQGEADLAVGGFTRRTVTAQAAAAPTYAHFAEALIVAAKPGVPILRELDGLEVFVPPGALAHDLVEREGGVPVAEDAWRVGLVALPHWRLPGTGLVPTGIVLRREDHVLAVPKEENAWLSRVERFLRSREGDMGAALREYAR